MLEKQDTYQLDKLMENTLNYTFDDEYVTKFCYDIDGKKIEIHFTGYSDLLKDEKINRPCIWVIENWKEAKSKLVDDQKTYDINEKIGIFSMILHIETKETNLEIIVNTIDNRYITLFFTEPKLSLKGSPKIYTELP